MGIFTTLFGSAPKVDFKEIVAQGANIVDVRTPQEFASGCIKGSINIPVGDLPYQLKRIDKSKPVIVYCASGGRSSSAKAFLEQNGFSEVYNGGGYHSLQSNLNE